MLTRRVACLSLALSLISCGGGGSDSNSPTNLTPPLVTTPPPASPADISWRGDGRPCFDFPSTSNTWCQVSPPPAPWQFRMNTSLIGWGISPEGVARTTDGGATWKLVGGYTLTALATPDANTFWGVGANGLIVKTIDAGQTWTAVNVSGNPALNDVVARDAQTALAVGNNGVLIATTDGTNWRSRTTGTSLPLISVSTSDFRTILAVGAAHGTPENFSVLTSTDGGLTWSTRTKAQFSPALDSGFGLFQVASYAPSSAWLVGSWATLHTDNNFQSYISTGISNATYGRGGPFAAADSLRAWVASGPFIQSTSNGGASWQQRNGPTNLNASSVPAWIDALPSGQLFVSAWAGSMAGAQAPDIWLTSLDDGQSWNTVAKLVNYSYSGLSAGAGGTVVLCCSIGSDNSALFGVVRSTDSGRTWQRLPTTQFWAGTATIQGTSIWAGDVATGAIYVLNDASHTWVQRRSPINTPLSSSTSAGQHIWFAGVKGTIIHSPDAGVSWESQSTGAALDIAHIYSVDSSHIWAYSSSYQTGGSVFYSANSGRTWSVSNLSAASGQITALVTLGPTSALVSGIQLQGPNQVEGLFLTTDGGKTWAFRSATSFLSVDQTLVPRDVIVFQGPHGTLLLRATVSIGGVQGPQTFTSSDQGQTWNLASSVPQDLRQTTLSADGKVFWGIGDGGNAYRIAQ